MKKITVLVTVMLSVCAYSQENPIKDEIIISPEVRPQASKGTYQLIFKDQASKDWFFQTGISEASEYVGVEGIDSYSDLLIVIEENRQRSDEQIFIIGDNKEVVLKVLSLDFIRSTAYQPLEEFTFKK